MVLEKLVSVREAVKNPLSVFFLGAVVSLTSLFVSYFVFPQSVGIFTSFMVTLSVAPFMYNLSKFAEARGEEVLKSRGEANILARHRDIIAVFVSFFTGMAVTFTFCYLFLPDHLGEKFFKDQLTTIQQIRGRAASPDTFQTIVVNNIGVLVLAFVFSFLYGTGAIFILAWNASVLGTVIGMTAKSIGGFKALPLAVLVYFPHGSLEMLAYFIGAIAGGIASAAVTRRKTELLPVVLKDSFRLLVVAIALLLVAGFIETVSIGYG
jgi:uncharacterized membrane protein SpoIIM required for sporulation